MTFQGELHGSPPRAPPETLTVFSAANNIKRCARADPGLGECLRDAVQDALPKLKPGLPKLGLATLDPLYVQELRIQQGSGPVSANLVLRDMVTTGLLDNVKVFNIQ